MKREITCINCPKGCLITVEIENNAVVSLTGNRCPRGANYARQEILDPRRIVTGLVKVDGEQTPLSVKTSAPVPKDRIDDVLAAIRQAVVRPPVAIGAVIIPDVCGLGADIVATRQL